MGYGHVQSGRQVLEMVDGGRAIDGNSTVRGLNFTHGTYDLYRKRPYARKL